MKVELESLGSLENQTSAIQVLNENFDRIEAFSDSLVSRDGTSPNFMLAPLDMNSERVMNVGAPQSGSDAARLTDITNALALDGLVSIPSLVGNQTKILSTDGINLIFKDPTSFTGIGDLTSTNNLSDLSNIPTARTNLGLGTAATKNIGTSGDTVPVLNVTNTWAGNQNLTGGLVLSGSANYRNSSVSTTLTSDSIGYRGAPTAVQDSNYTFVLQDAGQSKLHTSATAHNYTIPPNVHPVGTTILVTNIGTGAVSLLRGAGVTLRLAGAGVDKNMTVGQWGLCTLYQYATNAWIAGGSGVS